jgi:hypothetical protein
VKNILTVIILICAIIPAFIKPAQKPTYQAVIRNSGNQLIANKQVGIRISVFQGCSSRTPVYSETQTLTTDAYGLVRFALGCGTKVSGNLSSFDLSAGKYSLETKTDPSEGANYSVNVINQYSGSLYAQSQEAPERPADTITKEGQESANIRTTLAGWLFLHP